MATQGRFQTHLGEKLEGEIRVHLHRKTCVHTARKRLRIWANWKCISGSTQERSHTHVCFVGNPSHRVERWELISEYTQERSHSNVLCAIGVLTGVLIWKNICCQCTNLYWTRMYQYLEWHGRGQNKSDISWGKDNIFITIADLKQKGLLQKNSLCFKMLTHFLRKKLSHPKRGTFHIWNWSNRTQCVRPSLSLCIHCEYKSPSVRCLRKVFSIMALEVNKQMSKKNQLLVLWSTACTVLYIKFSVARYLTWRQISRL